MDDFVVRTEELCQIYDVWNGKCMYVCFYVCMYVCMYVDVCPLPALYTMLMMMVIYVTGGFIEWPNVPWRRSSIEFVNDLYVHRSRPHTLHHPLARVSHVIDS